MQEEVPASNTSFSVISLLEAISFSKLSKLFLSIIGHRSLLPSSFFFFSFF